MDKSHSFADFPAIIDIKFRAIAPKVSLPSLDEAHAKLLAIQSALGMIQGRLAGLTTASAFKRTTDGIDDVIKQLERAKGKSTLKQISEVLGFDPKDVREYWVRVQEKLSQQRHAAETKRAKLRGSANAEERKALLADEAERRGRHAARSANHD